MNQSTKKSIPTPEEVAEQFKTGFDCSQVVAEYFSEEMGLSLEDARKVTACFGGGSGRGGTCGAVVGAMMAIGEQYGHYDAAHMEQKDVMRQKRNDFMDLFEQAYGTSLCRELLGYDLSVPEEREKALETGTIMTLCPRIVSDAIRMTEAVRKEK